MSEVVNKGVEKLNERLGSFDAIAKFVIEGEGAILIDSEGARAGDGEADVTLTASRETFQGILDGTMNPTAAFMSGQLKIDGSMPLAMQLGAALS